VTLPVYKLNTPLLGAADSVKGNVNPAVCPNNRVVPLENITAERFPARVNVHLYNIVLGFVMEGEILCDGGIERGRR
jgi:hypothetical protein